MRREMSMAGLFRSMGLLSSTHPRAETANSAGLNPEPENLNLSRRPCVRGSRAGRSLGKSNALAPTPRATISFACVVAVGPSSTRPSQPASNQPSFTNVGSQNVPQQPKGDDLGAVLFHGGGRRLLPSTHAGLSPLQKRDAGRVADQSAWPMPRSNLRAVVHPIIHLPQMVRSLTFDHGFVDGGPAAAFLQEVGQVMGGS